MYSTTCTREFLRAIAPLPQKIDFFCIRSKKRIKDGLHKHASRFLVLSQHEINFSVSDPVRQEVGIVISQFPNTSCVSIIPPPPYHHQQNIYQIIKIQFSGNPFRYFDQFIKHIITKEILCPASKRCIQPPIRRSSKISGIDVTLPIHVLHNMDR